MTATEAAADGAAERRSASRCAARRTRGCSPAAPTGPTTSSCPGMLHMAILRSPMAHARITRVDVSPALARPGVVAAFCGDGARRQARRAAVRLAGHRGHRDPDHPPLAIDEVRYVGERVAVVVAARPLRGRRRARGDRGRLRAAARRCSTCGPRSPTAPTWCTTDLGTNKSLHLEARRRRLRGREGQGGPRRSPGTTSTSG